MKHFIFALLAMFILLSTAACSRRPVDNWTQGYESQTGYMQPDHGWFYYYFMYSMLGRAMTPTYHVYVPPYGYDRSYRPWMTTPNIAPTRSYSTSPIVALDGAYNGPQSFVVFKGEHPFGRVDILRYVLQ